MLNNGHYDNKTLTTKRYCVSFWKNNEKVQVIVDDLLPASPKGLLVSTCSSGEEMWVSIAEKAYAKLHGSYQSIEKTELCEALQDICGGLVDKM